jgi:hypothetical protein
MKAPSQSYLKVPYDLRPAKQVERRMLVETFQALSGLGVPINTFQYTGFGSVYFFDFVVFHKLLGIDRMLSVEVDETIRNRVRFNKPFRKVEIKVGDVLDEIPKLSPDRQHILWLDYDQNLTKEHLRALWLASAQLSKGSILLVTVDAEPPVKNAGPKKWRDYFRTEASEYLGTSNSLVDFAESKLIRLTQDVMVRAIKSGLASRDVDYIPLFSFSYADSHEMLTVGGMLGGDYEKNLCRSPAITRLPYLRVKEADEPKRIIIPRLTRKERIYLDKAMPCPDGWTPKDFELPPEYVDAYRETYRFFPNYGELLF